MYVGWDLQTTRAFHQGKVLAATAMPLKAGSSNHQPAAAACIVEANETAYIPVALARSHLERVVQDMHALQADHATKLATVVDRYNKIEASTKAHYEAFVGELKRRTLDRVQMHKQQYSRLQSESDQAKAEATNDLHQLQETMAEHDRCHAAEWHSWLMERDALANQHAADVLALRHSYEMELARLSAVARVQRENAARALAHCGLMSEDWRWEVQLLRSVEMATDNPTQPIKSDNDNTSTCGLDARLWVDWLVDRALHQADVHGLQTVLRQAKTDIAHTQAMYDDLMVTSQVAAVLATVVCDVVDTIQPTSRTSAAKVLPFPSKMAAAFHHGTKWKSIVALEPPQEYAHLIACEMDMEVLKTQLDTLKGQSTAVFQTKTAAKQRIKEWLNDFQAKYNRDPTLTDKAQVKDLYVAFKQAEDDHARLKQDTATAKAAYDLKVAEVETLQGSGNMRQFPHHTLVAHLRTALDDAQAKVDALQSRLKTPPSIQEPHSSNYPSVQEHRPQPAVVLERQPSLKGPVTTNTSPRIVSQPSIQALDASPGPAIQLPMTQSSQPGKPLLEAPLSSIQPQHPPLIEEHSSSLVLPLTASPEHSDVSLAAPSKDAQKRTSLQGHFSTSNDTQPPSQAHTIEVSSTEKAQSPSIEDKASILKLKAALAAEHEVARSLIETQLALQEELLSWRVQAASSSAATLAADTFHDTSNDLDPDNDKNDDLDIDEGEDISSGNTSSTSLIAEPKLQGDVDGSGLGAAVQRAKAAIEAGKVAWNQGDKAGCHVILLSACHAIAPINVPGGDVVALAVAEAATVVPAKGAVVLRKALDAFVAGHPNADSAVAAHQLATTPPVQAKAQRNTNTLATGSDGSANSTKVANEYKQKLKVVESKWKADRVKLNQLEQALTKANNAGGKGGSDGGDAVSDRVWTKKLADAEKKAQKVVDDLQTQSTRQITALRTELVQASATVSDLTNQVQELTTTVTALRTQTARLSQLEKDMVGLQAEAATAATLTTNLNTLTQQYATLESQYKEEQALRKKYYNTIEDMKGKIRVYCRCRPMSSSELDRNCHSCVRFLDDFTLEVDTARGPRSFTYDAVFNPSHTQDHVFEDTKHLLQSALDGYNVCIFAYGQTGSGKTFTMTGTDSHPGITKRLIELMFALQESQASNQSISYEASMLELYNDQLIDLLAQLDPAYKEDKALKLDIKKNEKGMVVVTNAASKECTSAHQTLRMFDAANKKRQVGSTKMNAESSRSHSVFTVLIHNYNKTTKQTSVGKLSLVDLAGSERAGKTGATADRLKEAQAINKSLSALGDVISALSTNEKFIPYRNNKLTQLMQDSLGGNAKTLMFVNISPADYNQEETQTSLSYASRVKLITNQANKTSDSEEVAKLKAIIKQLKAGSVVDDDVAASEGDSVA
ncbi:hypothetical protein, variant 1 [Aphanomyces astaci]|uniref:Kinesin motor domain-containing protein n=1 Tax=Aphanomyces astaci TaxID=112090 RepID=W4GN10_APHAT|nr:hypothetical protein, variant 1 [Aphanomyces astaci]ETV81065.1 hypothetical protein, variant 1 [Aphanomyces astaci]|eukprot:XP_009828923.1 hypothetical protein, variant 1 [Aphanomyces astaci]